MRKLNKAVFKVNFPSFDTANFVNSLFEEDSPGWQHTLKTTFMLWVEHRPPTRRWRSSRDEVAAINTITLGNEKAKNWTWLSVNSFIRCFLR